MALLNFLDVWGLGNRGMFRTIRDLLLRPGNMIRDYISGMQMAYVPPFKLFFLLTALSLLIDSGLNIKGENRLEEAKAKFAAGLNDKKYNNDNTYPAQEEEAAYANNEITEEDQEADKKAELITDFFFKTASRVFSFILDHQNIFLLAGLLILSLPLYLLFRQCPAIPDLHYPEFFVSMVYITSMQTILMMPLGLLCIKNDVLETCLYAFTIIPLKQLSGYSWVRTFINVVASLICIFVLFFISVVVATLCLSIFYGSRIQ